jgi:hypothetical protein
MVRETRILTSKGVGYPVLAVLISACSVLNAENQLRFVVRTPEVIDVHLANSDTVAAVQLFIHLEGIGMVTGAELTARTIGSSWQLPFNVLGERDIRMVLFSLNDAVLPPGSGPVARIYLGRDTTSSVSPTTLSFETAILAARDARSLDVDAEGLTFKQQDMPENRVVALTNYPNPFNPATTISYELKHEADVDLSIYDLQGRRIVQLVHGRMGAGCYHVQWGSTSEEGVLLPSGAYVCRLLVDGTSTSRKMILAK